MRLTIATAVFAFATLVTPALSGCSLLFYEGLGNIAKNHKPAPDVAGRRITRKRLQAMEEIEAALAVVDAGAPFTSYATAADDRCDKGENNLLTRDGYAYRCTLRMTHFYGASGDFGRIVLGFEDLIVSSGWQPPRPSFRETLASHYDRYCRGQRIAIFGAERGVDSLCDVSQLRPCGVEVYKMGGLSLWVMCGERGVSTLYVRDLMDVLQRVPITLFKEGDPKFDLYKKQSLQNVNALLEDIGASHQYVFSVTIQKTYFEN